ncbi:hypothetical protein VW23_009505 [Devosia insulae DS-56]|uniref:Uncharacterized protein n=1 Tax=Devosia insulae DS-56 TaxID=1116389 RepID=A0A1E5XW85_9HYPH|nr:hypothetical protein [Devosia insulae]OEO32853.1 hypothetical protein VW23_009505 [Devosia insulae DS-56]
MAARVDIRQMQVRDGDLTLPFTADAGAGTAVLDPLGQPSKLRTVRWGEKCRLARYADADPAFLEAQFLALCSDGGPADAVRRPALVALALWLQGTAAPPLPLDPTGLGEVTLGLCRTLGITPVQLGEMAVPEVEALWLALGQSDTAATTTDADPVADGMTRIVIEPDPRPATDDVAERPPETMPHGDKAVDRPVPRSAQGQPQPANGQAPRHTEDAAPIAPRTASASPAPAVPPASAPGSDTPLRVVRNAATAASPGRLGNRSARRGPPPRFRIETPSPSAPAPSATIETGPTPVATPAVPVQRRRIAPAASPAGATRSTIPSADGARAPAPAAVSIVATAAPDGGEGAAIALAGQLDTLIEIVARAANHRSAAPPDPDTSFESFGDRLAEAVNELGLTGAE